MLKTLLPALLVVAIPLLWGLLISGCLALLGVWKRANAVARQSTFVLVSSQLESAVEAAVHGLDTDLKPLLPQVATGKLPPGAFVQAVLADVKKQGEALLGPAAAAAMGTTMTALESKVVGLAAKKAGISTPL